MSLWLRLRHPRLRRHSGDAPDVRMRDREAVATEFYDAMGWRPGESGPAWVSDQATVLDLLDEDENEAFVADQVLHHYGVRLSAQDFALPFWLLLDRLAERRAL